MSRSAKFQSKRVTESRKKNHFALISLVIFLLGVTLFIVAPSQASRSSEKGVASKATEAVGPRANAFTRDPAEASRFLSSPVFVPAFLPPSPLDPDLVETFAANCTTPKSAFAIGDTVCVKVSGGPPLALYPRKIAWVANNNFIQRRVDIVSDPQTDTFTIPTPDSGFDFRGVWRVNSISAARSSVRASAFFTVSDPALPAADLSVYNGNDSDGSITAGSNISYSLWLSNKGPDTANNVQLSDATPANTTFLSGGQDSGPAFNCTYPATNSAGGNTTCTLASLPAGTSAKITLVYNINSGTGANTTIANTATISSATADPHDASNTPASDSPADNGDSSNNSATSRTIIIAGTAGATCTIQCPDNVNATANVTEGGVRGAHVNYDNPTATGSCGAVSSTPISGSFFPTGTTQVTVTSETGDGICSFNVTVEDAGTNPPTITCPSNKEANADDHCNATVAVQSPTTTGDNVTVSGQRSDGLPLTDPFTAGTTTVTWTATSHDAPGGNETGTATCQQTVIVHDVSVPVITCPANVTVGTDAGSCSATVDPGTATATDNCDTPDVTGVRSDGAPLTAAYPKGVTFITWTASDGTNSVSCSQTVTVNDNESPVLSCPSNIAVNADPGTCGAVVSYTAPVGADNCYGATTAQTAGLASGATFPVGTTTNTFEVTDASGNKTSCSFTVTVNDTQNPTISAPANVTAYTGSGATTCDTVVSAATLGTATASDNCPGVTVSRSPSGNTFPVGATTVTWTATDAHGNTATANQTVTVVDNTPPAFTLVPANVTAYTGSGATTCDAVVNPGVATASDNCGPVTITRSPAGNTFPLGTTTITWTAKDAANNTSTATQTVTVVDNTPPVISCPANITVSLPLNSTATSMAVSYPAATATDNCGGTTLAYSVASGSVFPAGPTPVTVTATDTHGNSASCTFTVTVLYDFTGFFSPVANAPTLNAVNAGRAVPVKFSLSGNKGLNIFAANNPYTVSFNCNSNDPGVDVVETVTAGGSSLSFGGDQYIYTWKTESSWAGTCRQLVITLNDGSVHVANFKFK